MDRETYRRKREENQKLHGFKILRGKNKVSYKGTSYWVEEHSYATLNKERTFRVYQRVENTKYLQKVSDVTVSIQNGKLDVFACSFDKTWRDIGQTVVTQLINNQKSS